VEVTWCADWNKTLMLCSMRVKALEGPLCVGLESQWLRGKHRLNLSPYFVLLPKGTKYNKSTREMQHITCGDMVHLYINTANPPNQPGRAVPGRRIDRNAVGISSGLNFNQATRNMPKLPSTILSAKPTS